MATTLTMRSAEAEDLLTSSHHTTLIDDVPTSAAHGLPRSHSDNDLGMDAFEVTMRLDTSEQEDPPLVTATPAPAADSIDNEPSHVEIAFSGSGGMFTYQMGVAAYIQDHFDVSDCHFSGCSGGSWAATLLAAETSVHAAWKVILANQQRLIPVNYSWYSGYGRYADIVGATIQELWADDPDVFKRVEQKHLHIAVTKFPSMKGETHNSWSSLEDLMKSIMASALVPFALSGKLYIEHRGQKYIDGCVSNFKGVNLPANEYSTLSDVSFHVKKLAIDTARASMTTLTSYLLPAALHKPVAAYIYRALPNLVAPHDVISPLSLTAGSRIAVTEASSSSLSAIDGLESVAPSKTSRVQRLLIRPWTWRGHSLASYHLTVDIATHQLRFDTGYKDAMENHHEFAAVLPLKQSFAAPSPPPPARAA